MPEISIIIPAHNAGAYLEQAVESVMMERECDYELIIVDDRSADQSLDFVRKKPDDRIQVVSSKGPSAAAARNTGLALAKGTYVKFLDADDWLITGMLGKQLEHLKNVRAEHKAVVSVGWYESYNEKDKTTRLVKQHPKVDGGASLMRRNLITGSVLHQRAVLERVGGFDEGLKAMEEFELHFRMALSGVDFVEYSEPVFVQRVHGGENRLSNSTYKRYGLDFLVQMTEAQAGLARKKGAGVLNSKLSNAFAYRYWEMGRAFLREGENADAEHCFELARNYHSTEVAGGIFYRWIVKIVSPKTAERFYARVRR